MLKPIFNNSDRVYTAINYSAKLSTMLIILLLLSILATQTLLASEKSRELVILNWSEYMDPAMTEAFEKKHNVKIKHVYFESDDARDQILLQTEGRGFDLILTNGITINIYRQRGWLQPLTSSKIPNRKHLENRWTDAFPSSRDYGVAYFWGTLGIAYRKDLVSKPIVSWKQLFEPAEELRGKILMVKSSRDLIGMSLKALGYSANSENPDELSQAEDLLLKQKPYVASYGYITLDQSSSLVKGDIIAATVYGGDALNVAEHNENIVYVLPQEGGNIWIDYFTLSSYAKQPELALEFINFINQPEWAAKNAEELYLATPNIAARKLLSYEILNDPVIYPNTESLLRSETYNILSPRAGRKRATIFTKVVN